MQYKCDCQTEKNKVTWLHPTSQIPPESVLSSLMWCVSWFILTCRQNMRSVLHELLFQDV